MSNAVAHRFGASARIQIASKALLRHNAPRSAVANLLWFKQFWLRTLARIQVPARHCNSTVLPAVQLPTRFGSSSFGYLSTIGSFVIINKPQFRFSSPVVATKDDEVPALATGWRSEVVGRTLDDVLEGRTAIRIRDPKSDNPLSFEPIS